MDELIPDPAEKSEINPFHGKGCNIYKGEFRERRPWEFLQQVAEGRSGPIGFSYQQGNKLRDAPQHIADWIDLNWQAFQ